MDLFGKIDGYVDCYAGFDFLGSTAVVKKVRGKEEKRLCVSR